MEITLPKSHIIVGMQWIGDRVEAQPNMLGNYRIWSEGYLDTYSMRFQWYTSLIGYLKAFTSLPDKVLRASGSLTNKILRAFEETVIPNQIWAKIFSRVFGIPANNIPRINFKYQCQITQRAYLWKWRSFNCLKMRMMFGKIAFFDDIISVIRRVLPNACESWIYHMISIVCLKRSNKYRLDPVWKKWGNLPKVQVAASTVTSEA